VTQRNEPLPSSARSRVGGIAARRKAHRSFSCCAGLRCRVAAPREGLSYLFDFFFHFFGDAVGQRRVGQWSRHLLAIGDHPVQKVR
jgi:hypothetical protein